MKGVIISVINFFMDDQVISIMNFPLLLIILIILLVALGICIIISRKNKLYITSKEQ